MSLGLVSPILNRGVRSRWVSTLPASSKMLTIDAAGDVSYTDIPTAAWGSITGTLSSQTDLQNALNAKLSLSGGTMTGAILIPTGTAGAPSIAFTDDTDAGIYRQANAINFSIGGTLRQQFQGDGSIVLSGTDPYLIIGTSLALSRDGNDILAQKRATAAQTFRVYNTFTDASNYERGKIEWSSNVLRIGTEKAGTGSARALELQTDGTTRLTVGATGTLTLTGIGAAGTSTLRVNAGSGSSFTQINDNGTVVIDSDTATGTFPLTLKYAGTTVASVSYQGTITGGIGAFSSLSLDSGFVILDTDATNVLAQRSSTAAQAYRIYNTFTNASNYERGQLAWESNEFRIGATAAGTGTQRNTVLGSWNSGGTFTPGVTVASTGVVTIGVGGANPLTLSGVTGQAPKITLGTAGQGYIEHSSGALQLGYSYADQVSIGGTQTTIRNQLNNTQGTITASTPLTLTQTWNNAAVTFTGILANVTDTASNGSSLLMDLQYGGSSKFRVQKGGNAFFSIGSMTYWNSLDNSYTIAQAASNGGLGVGGTDVVVVRDAAQTLAQRNSTNAQTFRIYNTYTDASNYERGKIEWSSNVLRIGTEKAGTGSARALELQTDGTTRLTVGATGDVTTAGNLSVGNNSIYLGGSGVIRLADYTRIHTPDSYGPIDIAPMTNNVTGVVRVYNTIRSLTNYERLECGQAYNANAFIRTAAGGTGTRRNLEIDAPEIKIAIATTQKIGFYNATPVVQPAAVADATDAASVITQLNLLLSRMRDLGLIAT